MKKTILLIDDNDDMRNNTSEILELANYNVIKAENGKEGLDMIKKSQPDLILCDIMMPELDGYSVLNAIENIKNVNGVPFVFVSAKADKSDIRNGMDLGADDYLTKPFTGDQLLKVVSTRLKKSIGRNDPFKESTKQLEDFFNGINKIREINFISEKTPVRKYKKGDEIYSDGDISNYLYYIVKGKVKTYKANEFGKELITHIYPEGEFFGHLALLNDNIQRKSASALEDSEIALISKNDFYQFLSSDQEVSMKLIKYISNNLIEAEERLLQIAYNSARKKMAEALVHLYKKYNSDNENNQAFSVNRENLSALAGITPESVSRHLTDFKNERLIENDCGIIKVIDLRKLEYLKN